MTKVYWALAYKILSNIKQHYIPFYLHQQKQCCYSPELSVQTSVPPSSWMYLNLQWKYRNKSHIKHYIWMPPLKQNEILHVHLKVTWSVTVKLQISSTFNPEVLSALTTDLRNECANVQLNFPHWIGLSIKHRKYIYVKQHFYIKWPCFSLYGLILTKMADLLKGYSTPKWKLSLITYPHVVPNL